MLHTKQMASVDFKTNSYGHCQSDSNHESFHRGTVNIGLENVNNYSYASNHESSRPPQKPNNSDETITCNIHQQCSLRHDRRTDDDNYLGLALASNVAYVQTLSSNQNTRDTVLNTDDSTANTTTTAEPYTMTRSTTAECSNIVEADSIADYEPAYDYVLSVAAAKAVGQQHSPTQDSNTCDNECDEYIEVFHKSGTLV